MGPYPALLRTRLQLLGKSSQDNVDMTKDLQGITQLIGRSSRTRGLGTPQNLENFRPIFALTSPA